jgi:predicted esterase
MAERWVKVAAAPDESVALLMDGVLKDAGIPSLIQRAAGFDAPDFLAAGPRDVLVPASLAQEARQVLEDTTGLGSYAP